MAISDKLVSEELTNIDQQIAVLQGQRNLLVRLQGSETSGKEKERRLVPTYHKADMPKPKGGTLSRDELLDVLRDVGKNGVTSAELLTEINKRRPRDKIPSGRIATMLSTLMKDANRNKYIDRTQIEGSDARPRYRYFYYHSNAEPLSEAV